MCLPLTFHSVYLSFTALGMINSPFNIVPNLILQFCSVCILWTFLLLLSCLNKCVVFIWKNGYIHQLNMFLSCSDLSMRRTCSCLIYGSSKYFFFNEKSIGELNEFMNISIIKCMLVFLSTDSLNFLIIILFFLHIVQACFVCKLP